MNIFDFAESVKGVIPHTKLIHHKDHGWLLEVNTQTARVWTMVNSDDVYSIRIFNLLNRDKPAIRTLCFLHDIRIIEKHGTVQVAAIRGQIQ